MCVRACVRACVRVCVVCVCNVHVLYIILVIHILCILTCTACILYFIVGNFGELVILQKITKFKIHHILF